MLHSRIALTFVALLPFAATGCGGKPNNGPSAGAPVGSPAGRYAPRTDFLVIAIPEGAPTRWYSPGCPPTRSARLFPNTPDRELAADLRKQLGKNVLDPTDVAVLTPSQADQITRLVDAHFGTPAVPTVRVPDWDVVVASGVVRPEKTFGATLNEAKNRLGSFKWAAWKTDWQNATAAKAELKLDDAALARGSLVYRRACIQCHGANGSGEAAYAVVDGPMPRDYRQGTFKYVTAFPPSNQPKKGLGAAGKPRRDDLKRTVRNGIDGTIMPAFPTLTEAELDDVVSYVIHLSVRGETEFATLAKVTNVGKLTEDDPNYTGPELDWLFIQNELWVLVNWDIAAKHPIPIPPDPASSESERLKSAVRGFRLYNSADFGCASCHANYGRAPQLKWDAWATVVQPRNLALGVYRGGHRGEDLYARIYGGIYPSGMTAFHDRLAKAPPGAPDPIWDIVHFLQALGDSRDRRRMQEMEPEVKLEP